MAKSKAGEFGPRVRKAVELVIGGKEAADISDKARKGIHEFIEAQDALAESDETKALKGASDRWDGTFGLNKKAMKTLVALHGMTDAKKADFLRTFLPGLEAILPDQMDLFTGKPEDSKTPSENKTPAPDGANAPLQ